MGAARYYRTNPVDAWQVTPDDAAAVAEWVTGQGGEVVTYNPHVLRTAGLSETHAYQIRTPHGFAWVRHGDYVTHDPQGFAVIAPDLFTAAHTAEEVATDAAPRG